MNFHKKINIYNFASVVYSIRGNNVGVRHPIIPKCFSGGIAWGKATTTTTKRKEKQVIDCTRIDLKKKTLTYENDHHIKPYSCGKEGGSIIYYSCPLLIPRHSNLELSHCILKAFQSKIDPIPPTKHPECPINPMTHAIKIPDSQ